LIVPVELVLPVIPLTAGVFDTQVLKHVLLAGPIVKLVLLLLIGFSVISWAIIFLKFRLFKGIERNQAGFARAFAGIATTGNASLATVAPGIAEALVATAAGLGAAIRPSSPTTTS